MMYDRLLPLGLLLLTSGLGLSRGFHHEDRDLSVLYGSTINLTCADDKFDPSTVSSATVQWLVPTGQLLDVSATDSTGHLTLLDNGSTLLITGVDRPDFGLYLCLVILRDPNDPGGQGRVHHTVRWTVNIDGPYYGDMWEKYWPRVQTGLMAGAAVFVFMSMLCINLDQFQKHRDRPEGEPVKVSLRPYLPDHPHGTQNDGGVAYRNPAFTDMPSSYDSAGVSSLDTDTIQAEEACLEHAHPEEAEPKTSF